MAPARTATGHQEEIADAPRCNVWWLWTLLGAVILVTGAWLVGLSVWGSSMASDLSVNASQHERFNADVNELKADVKELLRRTPAQRRDAP